MPGTEVRPPWSRQGCPLLRSSQKKRKSQTCRRPYNEQFEVIMWSCCYCGHGGMTWYVPGCDMCNLPRCGDCLVERFGVGWREREQVLYTWRRDAALRKVAALLGLPTAEPDLLQPPDLRDATTTITCTTLDPDPTYGLVGLQEGPLSAAIPERLASQSLNEHGLHSHADTLPSPFNGPRIGFDLSSLSLSQANTDTIGPDPSRLASSIPKCSLDRPSSPPPGTDTIDRIIAAFNRWRAEGSNTSNGSPLPSRAPPPHNSQSNQSTTSKQSRKRTSDQGNPSKRGGTKRAKTSIDEVPQARKEDKRLLACPFWKKDPIRHRNCFRGVKRIRDVKQHLRRNHIQPVFCPRCGMEFGDEDSELRVHMRAFEQCENREFPEPDGITALHQRALKRYSDRSADEAEQWYVIWGYLFPCGPNGQPPPPRPTSPYVDEDLSEDVLSFREFSHREGWRALADAGDPELSNVAFHVDEELLQRCLERIYESWLAKRSHNSQQSWQGSPITLSDFSTPAESAPTSDTTSIDHQILDDNIMSLSGFSDDLDLGNDFLGHQIDGPFDDLVAMPSLDNTTAETFPSVPLLSSELRIEHAVQLATLDPTLLSR